MEANNNSLQNAELVFVGNDSVREKTHGSEVMGMWAKPLMKRYAEIINHNNGDILEIGYGLGYFANTCYRIGVKSHTIVEFHPQILERLYKWAKDKPEVRIISGNWIDVLDMIKDKKYDGIYFDTGCMDENRSLFRDLVVDNNIKSDGVFGYFPMDDGDVFKYGKNVKCEMTKQGYTKGSGIYFESVDMPVTWVKYPL